MLLFAAPASGKLKTKLAPSENMSARSPRMRTRAPMRGSPMLVPSGWRHAHEAVAFHHHRDRHAEAQRQAIPKAKRDAEMRDQVVRNNRGALG
jgi:hypothetical protein